MVRQRNSSLIFIFAMILSFVLIISPNRVSADVKPITEVQHKLEGISEEEKLILANLFILSQEIEVIEREEAEVTSEIEALHVEIRDLESKIKDQQRNYTNKLDILKQVLVSYQRSGPSSYLETLLNSENLTNFLRNINIIKDFSRNIEGLLDSLEEDKNKLSDEKDKLAKNVSLLENKKEVLQESMAKKIQLNEEQSAYLTSFKTERKYYEGQLGNLEQMWKDSKIVFSQIVEEFSQIIEGGHFPQKALNLKFNFPIIKGTIYEKTFNDIFKEHSSLPEMIFHFYPQRFEIEVPEKHLTLEGTFTIEGNSILKFNVEKGSFYDMPLEIESIEELFRNGDLLIDIKNMAGDMLIFDISLKSIKILEGYLEFEVESNF